MFELNAFQALQQYILSLGAYRVGVVAVEDISFEPEFRQLCESNACGMYGRSWMCPPLIGSVDELIAQAKTYRTAIVYQTVDALEDSYDFEGMMAAGEKINRLSQTLRHHMRKMGEDTSLFLGSGGCRICARCAKLDNKPCRFPGEAMSSLEAYGINVSELARTAGMKYINGVDTVTYFGAVFLKGA